MNKKCREQIGKKIDEVEEKNVDEEEFDWGQSLRIKILVDLTQSVA